MNSQLFQKELDNSISNNDSSHQQGIQGHGTDRVHRPKMVIFGSG